MIIRKAELRDVPALFKLISRYALERVVLPRPLANLYEDVWEFTVAEENGKLFGCGALRFYNQDLAEIRSLCVDEALHSKGVGKRLTEALLDEAESYRLETVFALTVVPAFFTKMSFQVVPLQKFPLKVYEDCLGCPKYSCCDETAVSYELAWRHQETVEPLGESIEVLS